MKEVDIALLKQNDKVIMDKLNDIEKKLDAFINKADDKYASKNEVETLQNIVKWASFLIVWWFLTALINLILK